MECWKRSDSSQIWGHGAVESLSQDSTVSAETVKLAQPTAAAEVTCRGHTHVPLLPVKKDGVILHLKKKLSLSLAVIKKKKNEQSINISFWHQKWPNRKRQAEHSLHAFDTHSLWRVFSLYCESGVAASHVPVSSVRDVWVWRLGLCGGSRRAAEHGSFRIWFIIGESWCRIYISSPACAAQRAVHSGKKEKTERKWLSEMFTFVCVFFL